LVYELRGAFVAVLIFGAARTQQRLIRLTAQRFTAAVMPAQGA
jgi:hypothetical protein